MKNHLSYSGFTLVETLVAIAIIMLAITGPFMSAERTIVVASIVRDKMTASFLAQEGLEYARALRDKVYLEDCYEKDSSACKTWWAEYSSNKGVYYDILQCSKSAPCSLDTSLNKSTYSTPRTSPFGSFNTELHVCTAGPATCGKLYLKTISNPLLKQQIGQYTTTASAKTVPTSFRRFLSAKALSTHEIEVTSTVVWTNHGHSYRSSISDHFTPWY